jgi:ABC-2 type transport system permease protein
MTAIGLLLRKDLRVLRRSPVLLGALLAYPLLFALLVGLLVRFAGDRPSVAFVDLDNLPERLTIADQTFDVERVISQVNDKAELVQMGEAQAQRALETGEVVAAIVVPRGFAAKLRAMVESPKLVLRTGSGGFAGRAELSTQALVYRLNLLLQEAYISANLEYVKLLVEGGRSQFLGNEFDVVGLERAAKMLDELEAETSDPRALERIKELSTFVDEALLALKQSDETLSATANPIELETDREAGRTWLLSAQLQSYALALTLAFVSILLAAGAIAAERDENVIGRLARGLVRLFQLVVAKVVLAGVVALGVGLALGLIFGAAAEVGGVEGGEPWERLPLLAVGLVLAGAAFGAFGVLLGILAREARTAVLVAFLVALPVVLIGLVPEGSVAVASWISNAFPFGHAQRFFQSALFDLDPWGALGREALWLLAITAAFAALARLGVRRLLA